MSRIDVVVKTEIEETPRVKQISGMFDMPPRNKLIHEWHHDFDIESKEWNIGAILGPSGSGKTQIARKLWSDKIDRKFDWQSKSLIDDFAENISIRKISEVMNSVGFSTIPNWLKPYYVLSNGEQFRVDVARRILEDDDPIVIDEFTSVVDRQVAKVVSHSTQKAIRKLNRKLIVLSCHYDIEDWLQPDWVFEPVKNALRWRRLRRRPRLNGKLYEVKHEVWKLFAPYHYMSAKLHKSAKCFCLFVNNQPTTFVGILNRPISHTKKIINRKIWGVSRIVTLPDYQGLGLAFILLENIGSAYLAFNERFRMYPAHPPLIASFEKSSDWIRVHKAGTFRNININTSIKTGGFGGRMNGVYEYCGKSLDKNIAKKILNR